MMACDICNGTKIIRTTQGDIPCPDCDGQAMTEEQDAVANCPGHEYGPNPHPEYGHTACVHCHHILLTQAIVDANLNNALEGGHDCRYDKPEDICADMLAYSSDCETATEAELMPFVLDWKARKLNEG